MPTQRTPDSLAQEMLSMEEEIKPAKSGEPYLPKGWRVVEEKDIPVKSGFQVSSFMKLLLVVIALVTSGLLIYIWSEAHAVPPSPTIKPRAVSTPSTPRQSPVTVPAPAVQ